MINYICIILLGVSIAVNAYFDQKLSQEFQVRADMLEFKINSLESNRYLDKDELEMRIQEVRHELFTIQVILGIQEKK